MQHTLGYMLLLTMILMTGCASAPTAEQISAADYGPVPERHEETVKSHMSMMLKDPGSATYTFTNGPAKMWLGGGIFGQLKYGWGVCALVNAKNSFGGYTGAKKYFFLIRNDAVVESITIDYVAEETCQKIP